MELSIISIIMLLSSYLIFPVIIILSLVLSELKYLKQSSSLSKSNPISPLL